MSIRRAECPNGRIVLAVFLVMMTLGSAHAGMAFLPTQYLTMCVAIDGVLPAVGEVIDCNQNGIDDVQDIVDLTSPDCNVNGIPDECEINENSTASGGPFFCTGQCDTDCNHTGVPDECELAGDDGNGDGRPDECGVFISCDTTEDQELAGSDTASRDEFGGSVSIHGDTAIVGAAKDDCAIGEDCGAAYVYRFDGTDWIEQQKLTASDASEQDRVGVSVSISGNKVVIGAHLADCTAGEDCGAAYVFRFDGTNWIEQQKLTASDAAESDRFGISVSISGDTVVTGAYLADCPPRLNCGAAYVFRFDGVAWMEQQKLTASDASLYEQFGISVSIAGSIAIVGANWDDDGSAYIFRYDGTNWIEEQKLTASDAGQFDEFGISVAIGGSIAVVGANEDRRSPCNEDRGAAYVYRYDGTNWIEEQKLTATDGRNGDEFGISVSIDGGIAVVGANQDDCADGRSSCGSAYVYRYDGTNWIEEIRLTASRVSSHDEFGGSVAVSGDTVIVGAVGDGCCGAAYSLDLTGNEDCNFNDVPDQCDSDCNGNGIPDVCDGLPDSDADGVADDCDICPGGDDTLDTDGDGVPDDCDICNNNFPETCTFSSPILAPPPHDILKNRYISIDPRGEGGINDGLTYDIRVELASSLVNGVTTVGSHWWAGRPDADCLSYVTTCQPTTPLSWDACPILHLTGCPIIPTSTYDISVVIGGLLSDPPLVAATQAKPGVKWQGDCVGHFNGSEWTAPNGQTTIDDAVAAIKTFQRPSAVAGCGTPPCNATHRSVTDIAPNLTIIAGAAQNNKIVSIEDVLIIILGFQGTEYPGSDLVLCP